MRALIALVIAAGLMVFYGLAIWAFFQWLWPVLPPWLAMLFFIAIAVFAIGSPIYWLARWSDRAVVIKGRDRPRSDD